MGRCIQGIGGGGILSLGEILVTDFVPLTVRGAYLGYISMFFSSCQKLKTLSTYHSYR